MTPPAKKRRLTRRALQTNGDVHDTPSNPYTPPFPPVTDEEKRRWQGFCEIESEPAFFNVMLKDFGVKGVKVQEVVGLDEESLAMLPQPVYGMIFLFRYKTQSENNQEAVCPENVWFANQTHEFACATVSLLNIVNNIPGIELGGPLQSFKEFTKDFTPALRGDQIGSFEFVKQIHNSFARKMDIMCIDLGMENRFDDRRKRAPKKTVKPVPKKKTKKVVVQDDDVDDDSAFHFIAYVPIDGEVWKLDGLDRQPEKLGLHKPGDDWLPVVVPVLASRMAEYAEGQIEFVLLSLVRDPLLGHCENLAVNIKCIQAIQNRMDEVNPDWKAFSSDGSDKQKVQEGDVLFTPAAVQGVSERSITEAVIPDSIQQSLLETCPAKLMEVRQELVTAQAGLLRLISDEEASAMDDARLARERRQDYSPAIHRWLTMLAGKEGVVKDLIETDR